MPGPSEEPHAKKSRKRNRQEAEEDSTAAEEGAAIAKYERGTIWLDDGNIVVVAEAIGFRVYRGVLKNVSEVFRDMFSLPQPPDAEKWEDCPVVHLSDTVTDLRHILSVLFKVGSVEHGLYVSTPSV